MSSTSSPNFSWRSCRSDESRSSTSSTSSDWRLAPGWPPPSRGALCGTPRPGGGSHDPIADLLAQYLSARSIPLMRNAVVGDDVPVSIDEVAERLYALEPEEFTAARDQAAKDAEGGDRKAIKSLRKPTVAAYVANMLARQRRDDVEALVDLGDDLREAMAGKGDIRGLGEQRRELVRAPVHEASDAAGRELTASVEEEVAATLEAATADP